MSGYGDLKILTFTGKEHTRDSENFPNSWTGRGGSIPWLPRSPDITPCACLV